MIDRYSITVSASVIRERFSVDVPESYQSRYNAAPTHLLPVITDSNRNGISFFYWGSSPAWAKNKMPSEKSINVRFENFEDKPALRKALRKSRCVIPADGFYGWKRVGKKTAIPYRFVLNSRDPFAFAGLWEEFEDTEGNEMHTFSVITHTANELVGLVQDRMPVILTRQAERTWLDNSADESMLLSLLGSYPAAGMTYYPVSPQINDPDADFPSMIIATPPADQHGNLTLFD